MAGPKPAALPLGDCPKFLAERVGFEPTGRSRAQRFSRPPHSAALSPLHAVLSASAQPLEKLLEKAGAFLLADTVQNLHGVVQPFILDQIHQGDYSPGLGIVGPEHQAPQPRIDYGTCTHGAGFERNI